MWSTTGTVATYPSEVPRMLGAATVTQPGPPLTFRKDPASGIVYVTGRWYTKTSIAANGSFFDVGYTLPAAFLPITPAFLLYRYVGDAGSLNVQQLSLDVAGNMLNVGVAFPNTGFTFTINALYFTDV